MTLPLLISLPHGGLIVPPEVQELCILSGEDIIKDGDEGAAAIYSPLEPHVASFVTTEVARAIVDMNRAENDRRKDGVVKTHTCWDVPVYRTFPAEETVESLLKKYYRPYHERLTGYAGNVKLGIDCHTMASVGPPIGPDQGTERPHICLSNGDGTCPMQIMRTLSESLSEAFEVDISFNHPFKGGYIIRAHAAELPWVQLELSRAPFTGNEDKGERVLEALKMFCERGFA